MWFAAILVASAPFGQDDLQPRWEKAALLIGSERFPLATAPPAAQVAETPEVPSAWLTDDARVVERLLVPGPPPTLVAVVARGDEFDDDVEPAKDAAPPLEIVAGAPTDAAPRWRKALERLPGLGSDGVYVFAPRLPQPASGNTTRLTPCDGDLLVLSDERGHLLRLDPTTGAERARLEAPWEIERGFIGPSVWAHELCRFGDAHARFAPSEDAAALAAARAAYEARTLGWVVAGPVVAEDRAYLVIGHAAPEGFSQLRAECTLLELDARHGVEPFALTALPAPAVRAALPTSDGGVVWALRGEGMFRAAPIADADARSQGPGSHDKRGSLCWLFTAPDRQPPFFLRVDRPRDVCLFHGEVALRALDPYVPAADRRSIHLPIAVVDLGSGARRRAEVQLPLDQVVLPPSTNYTSNGTSYVAFGSRIAGLRDLCVEELEGAAGERVLRLVLTVDGPSETRRLVAPAEALAALTAAR